MRLNQFLANATDISRRAADVAIRQSRVHVDGKLGKIGQDVNPKNAVSLDGQQVKMRLHQATIILHKPVGYVSSRRRQGTHPSIYDLVPHDLGHLQIAGRLDQDSSGLLVLTSDGQLLYQLTHPKFAKIKTYEVTLTKMLSDSDRRKLADGIVLPDGLSQLQVMSMDGRKVIVAMTEGRNRQIRRTFGALDYGITRLHRLTLGPYMVGKLPAGQWQLAHIKGRLNA
jgi:pseudouridine synthase